MRNIIIKVIIEDDETELNVESVITYNQLVTLNEFGIDMVNQVLPQLHKQLDEKIKDEW